MVFTNISDPDIKIFMALLNLNSKYACDQWCYSQIWYNICPVVITSATYHPPPYSGHSICHLAIPSANTFNIVVITSATNWQ